MRISTINVRIYFSKWHSTPKGIRVFGKMSNSRAVTGKTQKKSLPNIAVSEIRKLKYRERPRNDTGGSHCTNMGKSEHKMNDSNGL